jgi:hypothetical protein
MGIMLMGQATPKQWSARVTMASNALTLDRGVFTWMDPKRIAASFSRRRKADP